MFRSWTIARPFGVEVSVHGTVPALIFAFAFMTLISSGMLAMLDLLGLAALVLASVTLHELGHIFAARLFGIGTSGLTLYPIGGIARLTREAKRPLEEFVVALAGPAVNVALAGLSAIPIVLFGPTALLGLPLTMFFVNIVMAGFNLIPAFPMDGGRVLRAALWPAKGQREATRLAARGGQIFAALFALAAIALGHLSLLFIAAFVYMQASAELQRLVLSAPRVERIYDDPGAGGWQGVRPGAWQDSGPVTAGSVPGDPFGSAAAGPAPGRPVRTVLIRTPFGYQRVEM